MTKTAIIHLSFYKPKKDPFAGDAHRSDDSCLEEAVGLAAAIQLDVLYTQIIQIKKVNARFLIGLGNVENLKSIIKTSEIRLLIVDGTLSPVQQRNLEKELNCKVIDRTGLILEIFGERAETSEGQLQVELASLTHQRSRLVRAWTHLERQRGGFGFIGGPGESQIELDRRKIDERIVKIKNDLNEIRRTRGLHRKSRERHNLPQVALVGYTNAGKSTLFNTLTSANVFAEDLLFATLDPVLRKIKLGSGQEIILSDTVGFISNLPTQLIEAFKATLEEVLYADIILHVRDVSHDDAGHQARDVEKVLFDLGIDYQTEKVDHPIVINVYNKIDKLTDDAKSVYLNKCDRHLRSVGISALKTEGIDDLLAAIDSALQDKNHIDKITIPASMGKLLAWCYQQGAVISEEHDEGAVIMTLALPHAKWEWLKEKIQE
jgi:GTP-binding protein HflX